MSNAAGPVADTLAAQDANVELKDEDNHLEPTSPIESDNGSALKEKSKPRQRTYRRGGRKNKSRLGTASDAHKPWSERNGRLEKQYESELEVDLENEEIPNGSSNNKKASLNGPTKASQSGFEELDPKRPDAVGVNRSSGINTKGSKTSPKSKTKTSKKKKGKQRQEDSDEDSSGSDEEEPEKKTPVSIKLDINLEVEIFFRVKIKGDVTVTFL